ncbi:hypothetical protein COU60_01420 [Candidatus Pacearchaeota archaeon CG10_big_fil_rev_8_21_14_0_10_34_76]|nr:MAG: hypothetical protein COU60_01420 [Candidatus Pacearchaeota archaeon CG10_big_fil_rev_8_21_14_0_10_34_76]
MAIQRGVHDNYFNNSSNHIFYRVRFARLDDDQVTGVQYHDCRGDINFIPLENLENVARIPAYDGDMPRNFVEVLQEIGDSGADAFFGLAGRDHVGEYICLRFARKSPLSGAQIREVIVEESIQVQDCLI